MGDALTELVKLEKTLGFVPGLFHDLSFIGCRWNHFIQTTEQGLFFFFILFVTVSDYGQKIFSEP